MAGSTSKRYPPELRERAVRMVAEIAGDHESQWAAMNEVARLLGIGTAETVRKWVRQVEVDAGQRPGAATGGAAELKRLRRENAELKRANGILKAASTFFASMPSSEVPGRGSLVSLLPQVAGGFSRVVRPRPGAHDPAGSVAS